MVFFCALKLPLKDESSRADSEELDRAAGVEGVFVGRIARITANEQQQVPIDQPHACGAADRNSERRLRR